MRIIALDPGVSTGLAVLEYTGEVVESRTLSYLELGLLEQYRVPAEDGEIRVVIEDTPIPTRSKMNRSLFSIMSKLKEFFPDATYIAPGIWKAHPIAKTRVSSKWFASPPTQHQRDAIHLGLYYLVTEVV